MTFRIGDTVSLKTNPNEKGIVTAIFKNIREYCNTDIRMTALDSYLSERPLTQEEQKENVYSVNFDENGQGLYPYSHLVDNRTLEISISLTETGDDNRTTSIIGEEHISLFDAFSAIKNAELFATRAIEYWAENSDLDPNDTEFETHLNKVRFVDVLEFVKDKKLLNGE